MRNFLANTGQPTFYYKDVFMPQYDTNVRLYLLKRFATVTGYDISGVNWAKYASDP